MVKKPERSYILLVIFAIIYVLFSLFLHGEAETLTRYNLTPDQARNLRLSVILPYIGIWFFAFFGFVRLKNYSQTIRKNEDGRSLSLIADGLFVLSIGLAISAILSRVLTYIGSTSPHLIPLTTIIGTYIDIIIGLVSMSLIYKGAQRLVNLAKGDRNNPIQAYSVMIGWVVLTSSYAYLTLTNPARQFPTPEINRAAYYLPDILLVTTVVIPFFIIWYRGLLAAYYIYIYRKDVRGTIYRKALGYLASGIMCVVLSRIAVRYLTSLNTIVATWTLRYLLIFVYCLLILIAVGFGLIARGANKLKKIEEV